MTTREDDDVDERARESGEAVVPAAWRRKRVRLPVIAAAVIVAAAVGFGGGRAIGLGDNVILSGIPRPATTATPFIEDDDGIGGGRQTQKPATTRSVRVRP